MREILLNTSNKNTLLTEIIKLDNKKQTVSRNFFVPLHFGTKSTLFHRFYNFANDNLKVVYAEI